MVNAIIHQPQYCYNDPQLVDILWISMILLGLPQTRLLISTDFLGWSEARYAEPKEQLLSAQRQNLGIFDFLIFATILVTFRRSIRYISLESLDLPTKLFFYSASDSPGEVRSLPQDLDFAWSLLARGSPHQTISDLDCPWWLSVVSWGETTVKRLNWGRTEAVLQRQKRGKYPAVTLHRSSLAWPWVQHWKQLDGCSYSMPWTLEVATQDTSR